MTFSSVVDFRIFCFVVKLCMHAQISSDATSAESCSVQPSRTRLRIFSRPAVHDGVAGSRWPQPAMGRRALLLLAAAGAHAPPVVRGARALVDARGEAVPVRAMLCT